MKILLALPFLATISLPFNSSQKLISPTNLVTLDTGIINHVLDGSISEWPQDKFQTDKETNIQYAEDNDAQKLFLALKIPDFRTQMKMMRQGMNVYIDMKGKKKEKEGIEFPLKRDQDQQGFSRGSFGNQGTDQNNQQSNGNNEPRRPDMKTMRASFAANMLYMKPFGFTSDEPVKQGLETSGSANIEFSWDSSNVMYIEYAIPLKMLDESVGSLNQKTISIGWKINGVDLPSDDNSSSFGNSSFGSGGGGGRGGRGGGGGGFSRGGSSGGNTGSFNQADMEKMTEAQSFWTKYTFAIPTSQK